LGRADDRAFQYWSACGCRSRLPLVYPHGGCGYPITFRLNDPEAPQMRQALDVFEQQNPGTKVDMQRVSWADAQQQYLREAAVGTASDVAELAQV
jgi:ABC-type glycerol-3-phosphate transport system substrate-binding protein